MGKMFKRILVVLLGLMVVAEIVLRVKFGFCDAVLLRSDPDYEYIAIPQVRFRFGNHIFYNSFSQRNEEPSDSSIILGFGDSVINGGTQTDQDSLATTRLSKSLSAKYAKHILVTNISAGSWGPDNCYAYLKKHGNFGAKQILLVASSHDAYDDMNFMPVVGKNSDFPDKQYPLALLELVDRYIIPRIFKRRGNENEQLGINKQTAATPFNTGLQNFVKYADSTHISFTIYLHADKNELITGSYNAQGLEIIKFCAANNVRLIKELDYHLPESAYRDNIHLNNEGQRKMWEILKEFY